MSKELKTVANRRWSGNYSGVAPTIDTTDGVYVGDHAVDTSTTPNRIWRCADNTNGAPIWYEIDGYYKSGIGTQAPAEKLHVYGFDTTPDSLGYLDQVIMIDGPATTTKSFAIGNAGEKVWEIQDYQNENSDYLYFYNRRNDLNPICINTGGRICFNKPTNIMDYHAWYQNPVTGAIDDLEVGGLYTKNYIRRYEVVIFAAGTPDTFKWRYSTDTGVTWSAYSDAISCSTSPVTIDSGITVTFENTTGHNTNDKWYFNAHPQLPQGTHTVSSAYYDEVLTTSDYTAETPTWRDVSANVAWRAASAIELLPAGTTSAAYIGRLYKFNSIYVALTTAGVGCTIKLEYWNGSAWTQITAGSHGLVDGTSNLTVSGELIFDKSAMSDWAKTIPPGEGASYNLYWIRITSTTNVTTEPMAGILTPNGRMRLGIFAGHLDSTPSFMIDPTGRCGIYVNDVVGANVLQVAYPYQAHNTSITSSDIFVEFDTEDSSVAAAAVRLSQATATGKPSFALAKSRGDLGTPANLATSDTIGAFGFKGYVNAAWVGLAHVQATYTGSGTTQIAYVSVATANSGSPADALRISRDSGTGDGRLQFYNSTTALGVAVGKFDDDGTLAANLHTSVPTQKAVKTYVDAVKVYGGMYQTANATATTISVASTWYKVLNFTSGGVLSGVTYGTSDLTVGSNGIYLVIYSADGTVGNSGDVIEFAVAVDGTAQTKTTSKSTISNTGQRIQGNSQGLFSLNANQVVTLMVRNTASNRNITVANANVALHRIA